MRTFEASSVVSASLLGGLLAPTNRAFPGGIGGCVSQILAALSEPAVLALKKNSATEWEISLVAPADRTALDGALDPILDAGEGLDITGTLPAGGTKRHTWTATDDVGSVAMTGPIAAGIYSLEDMLNNLLDGGFNDQTEAMDSGIAANAISYLIIDQPNGKVFALTDGAAASAAYDAAAPQPDATLTSTLSAWE